LISGFGYLAYNAVQKRKENEFEIPRQRELPRQRESPVIPQSPRPAQPVFRPRLNYGADQMRINESLRAKQQQMDLERKRLFEPFGAVKPQAQKTQQSAPETQKEEQKAKPKNKEIKRQHKPNRESKKKVRPKKSKEDVFIKLQEIARESKNKIKGKNKNASAK